MKLPHLERAVMAKEKLTGYLLSETHPDGAPKAEFFRRFGFGLDNWQELARALLTHAAEHNLLKQEATPFADRRRRPAPKPAGGLVPRHRDGYSPPCDRLSVERRCQC